MKVATANIAVPIPTKRRFADACRKKGLKIYSAADQALNSWLLAHARHALRSKSPALPSPATPHAP